MSLSLVVYYSRVSGYSQYLRTGIISSSSWDSLNNCSCRADEKREVGEDCFFFLEFPQAVISRPPHEWRRLERVVVIVSSVRLRYIKEISPSKSTCVIIGFSDTEYFTCISLRRDDALWQQMTYEITYILMRMR